MEEDNILFNRAASGPKVKAARKAQNIREKVRQL